MEDTDIPFNKVSLNVYVHLERKILEGYHTQWVQYRNTAKHAWILHQNTWKIFLFDKINDVRLRTNTQHFLLLTRNRGYGIII